MAIDQAMYEHIALEDPIPTIRFYKWVNNAISLGAYQSLHDINIEACRHYGVELVRRMTGSGFMSSLAVTL